MHDGLGRRIDYVRLSLTDRCDMRCRYCMAEEMVFLPRSEVLSLEEIAELARRFVARGVTRIRLTGGEPLARRGAVGALIVHDTPGAGYGWNTVVAPHGENYDIAGATGRLALQGWIREDAAKALFVASGLDYAGLRAAASTPILPPAPKSTATPGANCCVLISTFDISCWAKAGAAKANAA